MLTWRAFNQPALVKVKVWILPNGWFVTTDGYLHKWKPNAAKDLFPNVEEDPDGGIRFVDEQGVKRVELAVLYKGEKKTIGLRGSIYPYATDLPNVQKQPTPLVLVGSAAFTPLQKDLMLDQGDPNPPPNTPAQPTPGPTDPWFGTYGDRYDGSNANFPAGTRRQFGVTALGTSKGGRIELVEIAFQAAARPGLDTRKEFIFRGV